MRWVYLVAATGWTAIIGLAYWLAQPRLAACMIFSRWTETSDFVSCTIRATATRDDVLIVGLTVALVAIVVGILQSMWGVKSDGWWRAWRWPANRGQAPNREQQAPPRLP